jgi:hypothetical protein
VLSRIRCKPSRTKCRYVIICMWSCLHFLIDKLMLTNLCNSPHLKLTSAQTFRTFAMYHHDTWVKQNHISRWIVFWSWW